ncbi:MAG: peptide deformylase [Deltaproteobacteria bacterium]|nr:peptide deformylase [Deltaproteobacteria bacterium]
MAILDIVLYPASVLHKKADPVDTITDDIRRLIADMTETMYATPTGVGLAAPQVGHSKRMTVIDVSEKAERKNKKGLLQMINPRLLSATGEVEYEEGCLSLPGLGVVMQRKADVVCTYQDPQGREQTITATGFLAIAIQHEIDHLDGKLIIDGLSDLKKDMYLQKLKKALRDNARKAI